MFKLSEFIKGGLLDAVGKMGDYQVVLNAAGWYEKGVLTESDLAEISAKIEEKNAAATEPEATEPEATEPEAEPVSEESLATGIEEE